MSVFRERVEKHKDELAELQEQEKLLEKEKPVRHICYNVIYLIFQFIFFRTLLHLLAWT